MANPTLKNQRPHPGVTLRGRHNRFATDSSEYLLYHGKPPQILEHASDYDVAHLQRSYYVDGAYPF